MARHIFVAGISATAVQAISLSQPLEHRLSPHEAVRRANLNLEAGETPTSFAAQGVQVTNGAAADAHLQTEEATHAEVKADVQTQVQTQTQSKTQTLTAHEVVAKQTVGDLVAFVAAAGGAESANATDMVKDAQRLINMAKVKSSHELAEERGPCACRDWKDVYENDFINCGQALELHMLTKTGISWEAAEAGTEFGHSLCQTFFQRLPGSFCVNVEFGKFDEGQFEGNQWCYVSEDCEELNGGSLVENTDVAYKMCDPKTDELSRNKTPAELTYISRIANIELGIFSRFAWPVWQDDRWPEVEMFFTGATSASGSASAMSLGMTNQVIGLVEHRTDLQDIIDKNETVLFEGHDSARAPYYIVRGKSVYRLDFRGDAKKMNELGAVSMIYRYWCISGPDCEYGKQAQAAAQQARPAKVAAPTASDSSSAPQRVWSQGQAGTSVDASFAEHTQSVISHSSNEAPLLAPKVVAAPGVAEAAAAASPPVALTPEEAEEAEFMKHFKRPAVHVPGSTEHR